jgi:thiol:disulfide interchange protein DsbD
MRLIFFILTIISAVAAPLARAATTEAQLLLAAEATPAGSTVLAGVRLKMAPHWHTYWINPGEAGQATEIKWDLPAGITAGDIQWPLPQKIPPTDITTYGYENEVVLLVPLTISPTVPQGSLKIAAKVSWLECKDSCLPASGDVEAMLTVATEAKPTAQAALLEEWQAKVPASVADFSVQAWWDVVNQDGTRALHLQWPGATNGADFFPYVGGDFEIQGGTETLPSSAGTVHIRKLVKKFAGVWPKELSGVFINGEKGVQAKAAIGQVSPAAGPTAANQPLWQMLLFAFIGGLILNIMPCVLPVIALKILGFVNEAKSSPRQVRLLGVVYSLGVLTSFMALAGVVVGVKLAGHQAAWGMQFGNPIFLVCLTALVTLIALNLFGIFEITLSGGLMDAASGWSAKSGPAGAFFNGVLATALATPCTAPILGSALGFAFTQSALTLTVVFLFIGLGLAAPYLVLSWHPAWLKFLPKPGAWMEKFKIAMGFPMLATGVWLFNIAASTYGKKVLWLGFFLVLLAAAAWTYGEFVQRGRRRKTVGLAVTLALLLLGYGYALEKELNWRNPVIETAARKQSPDGIAWQPWSPEAVAAARSAGKIVLVDFTADWCATCQWNKKTSLEIPSVQEKLKALDAVVLLGDYTHLPDAMTEEIKRFNRAGVPLVLVYPRSADAPPIVLPEFLTPGVVLKALDAAAN